MSSTQVMLARNEQFIKSFDQAKLPVIPKLRAVILACVDARVDPSHIFGLELGDSVVIRNNGGRVTPSSLDEIIALAMLVAMMDGDSPGPFNLVLVQHTKCGAERFADPLLQSMLRERAGVDVSATAVHDHHEALREDVNRLRDDPRVPSYITVSALLYDIDSGGIEEVVAPVAVEHLRLSR